MVGLTTALVALQHGSSCYQTLYFVAHNIPAAGLASFTIVPSVTPPEAIPFYRKSEYCIDVSFNVTSGSLSRIINRCMNYYYCVCVCVCVCVVCVCVV